MSGKDPAAPEAAPEAPAAPAPEATPEVPANETPAPAEAPKVFDEKYVKELRSEAAKWRTEAQAAKAEQQKREDAEKSDLERAQAQAERSGKEAAEAATKLLRYEVAAEKSVPVNLLPLLTGATKEALEQQADLIIESTTAVEPAAPSFDGGPRQPAPEPAEPGQAHNALIGQLLSGKKQ